MEEIKIGVVGLGYVGLPLARLFATKYAVVGFDLKKERIEALNRGIDRTLEVSEEVMKSVLRPSVPKRGEKGLYCSCDPEDLRDCNYYIITVPTPVDKHNQSVRGLFAEILSFMNRRFIPGLPKKTVSL